MKIRYSIKSVPSDDPQALEDLLNKMAETGWDLYTMQEIETEEGFVFNCIFTSERSSRNSSDEDIINIKNFRSQMEKILFASQSPYLSCKELQQKIKQKREKIQEIKRQGTYQQYRHHNRQPYRSRNNSSLLLGRRKNNIKL